MLGNKIKKLRIAKGMSQDELAKKSGISRVAIGNYERGDRVPKIDVLSKIAVALEVSLSELDPIQLDPLFQGSGKLYNDFNKEFASHSLSKMQFMDMILDAGKFNNLNLEIEKVSKLSDMLMSISVKLLKNINNLDVDKLENYLLNQIDIYLNTIK